MFWGNAVPKREDIQNVTNYVKGNLKVSEFVAYNRSSSTYFDDVGMV